MERIYFDNSATTPLCDAAKSAMLLAMERYGNPSSLHSVGEEAHAMLETARRQVAKTLGIKGAPPAGQITFTSGGSEADNLAILGTAYAKPRRRGGRVITTDSEHSAIRNAVQALENDGFEVVRVSTKGGVLDWAQYQSALNERTFLVSLMMTNNETGAMYELSRAFALAKATNEAIVTHTDAVQGYLKSRFTPQALRADLVSVSAHKINGPKGVGALYASPEALKRRDFVPLMLGGGQEAGFRSGTENIIGIAGFGAAAEDGFAGLGNSLAYLTELRQYAEDRLSELPIRLNIPAGARAPHILNLTLPDIKSETMLHALSAKGVCVSHGSACSSHAKKTSSALTAFGLSPEEAASSIRLSFGTQNKKEEIDRLALLLGEELERLVRIHR